jgi:hypothetical protein
MKSLKLAAVAASLGLSSFASAAVLFSDSFDSGANWNVLKGTAASTTPLAASNTTQSADFGFNYLTSYGIPAAPSGTSTTGLRLRSNLYGGVQSGVSAFLTSAAYQLPSNYAISFDVYSSAVNGGTNSTEAAAYGIAGNTQAQVSANGNGVYFAAVRDSTATPFRSYYSNGTAGPTSGPQTAAFLAKTVTQTGTVGTNTVGVAAGYSSQAWRTITITNDGTNIIWQSTTDNAGEVITLRTVALSAIAANNLATATNPFVGSYDTSTGSSAADEATAYSGSNAPANFNFELFDNFTVNTVPEPTSLALLGLGGLTMLRRRRA